MKNGISLVLLALLILNCSADDNASQTAPVTTTLISKGNLYGNGAEGITQQNIVINNATAWNALIDQMDAVNNVSDSFTETDIDFNAFKVIAVFDAIRSNGGHSLELDVVPDTEQVVINITDISPQGNATTVITQPYHIIKITATDLPIVFE